MSLATDPRPPLPDWVLDAYTILCDHITGQDHGESQRHVLAIPRDDAIKVLRSTDEIRLEPGDADHALTRLIDHGYLYEVDSELRVTEPPEDI
ncbi:hypothetical protein [Natrinema amylolyticum]|uniref:hypothetical protein n=1 Tax=Natrinema amylolyticum TaxID=2878679 RepID=UPI001CFAAD54|nr:hypothetical protein [Natrinema amylolyticum]